MKHAFFKKQSNHAKKIATFVLLLFVVVYACREEFSDSGWKEENARAIEYA